MTSKTCGLRVSRRSSYLEKPWPSTHPPAFSRADERLASPLASVHAIMRARLAAATVRPFPHWTEWAVQKTHTSNSSDGAHPSGHSVGIALGADANGDVAQAGVTALADAYPGVRCRSLAHGSGTSTSEMHRARSGGASSGTAGCGCVHGFQLVGERLMRMNEKVEAEAAAKAGDKGAGASTVAVGSEVIPVPVPVGADQVVPEVP